MTRNAITEQPRHCRGPRGYRVASRPDPDAARIQRAAMERERGRGTDYRPRPPDRGEWAGGGGDCRACGDKERTGKLRVVAGHRRLQAVQLVNERRSARGKGLLRLRCVVDRSERDHLHTAIATNVQRRNLSPMDLALLIERLRKKFKWAGQTGTAQVAAYLGVLRITVTQHERLRTLSDDLQEQVHRGTLTPQSAFELMPFPPEERPRILHRAREIQSERDAAAEEEKERRRWRRCPISSIRQCGKRYGSGRRSYAPCRPWIGESCWKRSSSLTRTRMAGPMGRCGAGCGTSSMSTRGPGDRAEMRGLFGCMIVGCVKGTPGSASAARSGGYRAERRDKKH